MDLSSLAVSIEEVARCPICLEMVRPPVTLCVNGHGTCSECKAATTCCSVCKGDFISTTQRILNDILQLIPKLCKFAALGCKEVASDHHKVYCGFREVKCIMGNDISCTWRGKFKDWISHLNSTHTNCRVTHQIDQVKTFKYLHFRLPYRVKVTFHNVDNNTFILYAFKNRGQFIQTVRLVTDKEKNHIYYYKISFWNDDELLFQSRLEATVYDEAEDLENSSNCMGVPMNELLSLVMDNGDLKVTCLVTSKQIVSEK